MNKIPLNDTARLSPHIISETLEDISSVISSGRWLLGEYTNKFSSLFSDYIGVEFCVPVANGTDALELAIKAIVEKGKSEVITVANAGGYTSTACYLNGLKPVYIDVEEDSMLMDISQIGSLVSKNTACVVVTHLYGRAVDVSSLRTALTKQGYKDVPIIEDCAQAHGACINGQKVGSLGDVATFSFYPTKNLGAVGDAGAVVTNKRRLFDRIKCLSQYGWASKYDISMSMGRNSRMDEIQAAVLCKLLSKVDEWNERRRDIYSKFKSSNKNIKFYEKLDETNVVHLAILRTKDRDGFLKYMHDNGVLADVHYPILDSEQKAWQTSGTKAAELPISKLLKDEIVTLPCFPTMTDEEVEYICSLLRKWKND